MARNIPIKLYRRIGGAAGAPGALIEGEPGYNNNGANGNVNGDLFIGDGTAVRTLVSATRQIEMTGAQVVTTGAGNLKTFDTTNFHLSGGTAGQILTVGAGGTSLTFANAPSTAVAANAPITGNGLVGTELGVTPATHALATDQVQVGTDNVYPVSSAGLRSQLGQAATALNLGTTATTVVPAIHELAGKITALTGAIILVGTYDAATNAIDGVPPAPATGNLPAAAAGNRGWYFIVDVAGTDPSPHLPTGTYAVGDWILSSGTEWLHFQMNLGAIVASNVAITAITGMTGITNVQTALEWLRTNAGIAEPTGVGTFGRTVGSPNSWTGVLPLDGGTMTTVTDTIGGINIAVNDSSWARPGVKVDAADGYGMQVTAAGSSTGMEVNIPAAATGTAMQVNNNSTGASPNYGAIVVDQANTVPSSGVRVQYQSNATATGAGLCVTNPTLAGGGLRMERDTGGLTAASALLGSIQFRGRNVAGPANPTVSGAEIRSTATASIWSNVNAAASLTFFTTTGTTLTQRMEIASNGVVALGTPTGPAVPAGANLNIEGGYYVNGVALTSFALSDIHVDGVSITGTGTSADPFEVDVIDGGTF